VIKESDLTKFIELRAIRDALRKKASDVVNKATGWGDTVYADKQNLHITYEVGYYGNSSVRNEPLAVEALVWMISGSGGPRGGVRRIMREYAAQLEQQAAHIDEKIQALGIEPIA
jgi:hypothetical protein